MTLSRPGWADYAFAFHDSEEIGPKMLPGLESGPVFNPKISDQRLPSNKRLKLPSALFGTIAFVPAAFDQTSHQSTLLAPQQSTLAA